MPRPICGIYLTNEQVNALCLRPTRKGLALTGADAAPLPEGDDDALGSALKPLVKSLGLAGAEAHICLPKQQAILRDVTLPSTQPDELSQMVRYEAERHIPFHADRHCVGYHVMKSRGIEGSEVLIAAVDGPVVERALSGVAEAGLRVRGVTLSSVALMNSLLHVRREWMEGKTIALLCLGLDTVDLALVHQNNLIYARSVVMDLRSVLKSWLGLDPATPDREVEIEKLATACRMIDCLDLEAQYSESKSVAREDHVALVRGWLNRLVQELQRTYDFARREMKCPQITAVVLTGEGALLRNIERYLYVNLNVEIQTLNPVGELTRSLKKKMPFDGLEFVIPCGAALTDEMTGGYRIDLTPREFYRRMARRQTLRQLSLTGVLAAITLVLGVLSLFHLREIQARELKDYQDANRQLRPAVNELEEKRTKLGIIQGFLNPRNSALNVLLTINRTPGIASRVRLTRVVFEKGETVTIEGTAKTVPDITTFAGDLRQSGQFASVTIPRQEPRELRNLGETVWNFSIEAPLLSDAGGDR
ncbi:MAG TPA: pilus assembly protein PilM [Candidatus Sumerlaeota bacterium]|nr:MAG: Competence protein A [candidate division BRC1 bacterium ADurb.BinA292]HPK01012.1 pilus assembly protein PilM [Candidatus Sumerlaeota bacterium]